MICVLLECFAQSATVSSLLLFVNFVAVVVDVGVVVCAFAKRDNMACSIRFNIECVQLEENTLEIDNLCSR